MEIFLRNGKINPAGLIIIFLCCFFINVSPGFAQKENLDVFQQWVKWNDPGSMLIHDLIRQAHDYYDVRDAEIAKLKTKSDWQKRQALVKDKLLKLVGPFPEKTPLNVKITGVLHKEGYRVEKIIYESMPKTQSGRGSMFNITIPG